MSEKNYIGKGKEGNFRSVRVSIKMSEAQEFITEGKSEKYLNFFVTKMKEADQYGSTHTAYCLQGAEKE